MNDLEKSLRKISADLMKVAQKTEALAAKLDTAQNPGPAESARKKASKKTPKPAAPTSADTVYKVIARYKKGAGIDTIKQKTGYDAKKIQNLVYKLKKQDKIKSETKGVYMKA